jgi:hypothetical protein
MPFGAEIVTKRRDKYMFKNWGFLW